MEISAAPPLSPEQAETAAAAFVRFVMAVYKEDARARARIDALIAVAPQDGADLQETEFQEVA